MKYTYTTSDENTSITFLDTDGQVHVITTGHPHMRELEDMVLNHKAGFINEIDEERCLDLIDSGRMIQKNLAPYSNEFRYDGGVMYYKTNILGDAITKTMMKALANEDNENNASAIINFVRKLYDGVDSYSVINNLYSWVRERNLTITSEGNIVAYKAVNMTDEENEVFESLSGGIENSVIVDGVAVPQARVPQKIGSVVEMNRSLVDDNPNNHCSSGLHAGSWDYASTFGGTHVLTVVIDPADIVSVPNDHSGMKMRTCRYKITDITKQEIEEAVVEEFVNEDRSAFMDIWRNMFGGTDG